MKYLNVEMLWTHFSANVRRVCDESGNGGLLREPSLSDIRCNWWADHRERGEFWEHSVVSLVFSALMPLSNCIDCCRKNVACENENIHFLSGCFTCRHCNVNLHAVLYFVAVSFLQLEILACGCSIAFFASSRPTDWFATLKFWSSAN